MLKLTMIADEYITIGGGVVVQLIRAAGGRADVAVEAPREVPIVRGTVLERQGGQRPACLDPPPKRRARRRKDQIFRWNDDKERAVRVMERALERLDQSGAGEDVKVLRAQLERIVPAVWEEDLAAQ